MVESPWERIGQELANLRDGQTIARSSHWDRKFQYPMARFAAQTITDDPEPDADLYAFAGRATLHGNGDFTFTRNGDRIGFEGFVNHRFDERYNFEKDSWLDLLPFLAPDPDGALPRSFTQSEGLALEKGKHAKPFQMVSGWGQRVTGTLRIDPSGRLVLEREPVWTNVDPGEIQR